MPYKRILDSLLGRVAGARSVLLLDAQGEVVVGAGELDERERLIGAYQGISLGMVSRAAERVGGGEVKSVVSRHASGTVVLTTLRDGYYLVVSTTVPAAWRETTLFTSPPPTRSAARETMPSEMPW